jgi:hypothetical protein
MKENRLIISSGIVKCFPSSYYSLQFKGEVQIWYPQHLRTNLALGSYTFSLGVSSNYSIFLSISQLELLTSTIDIILKLMNIISNIDHDVIIHEAIQSKVKFVMFYRFYTEFFLLVYEDY